MVGLHASQRSVWSPARPVQCRRVTCLLGKGYPFLRPSGFQSVSICAETGTDRFSGATEPVSLALPATLRAVSVSQRLRSAEEEFALQVKPMQSMQSAGEPQKPTEVQTKPDRRRGRREHRQLLPPAALLSPPRVRHHVIKQVLKQPASEMMRRITKWRSWPIVARCFEDTSCGPVLPPGRGEDDTGQDHPGDHEDDGDIPREQHASTVVELNTPIALHEHGRSPIERG